MKTAMKYRPMRYLPLLACTLWLLASCTDYYKEYNTNPNEATEEMKTWDDLWIGGLFPQMQRDVIPTSDELANQYQRVQNLTGDIYSGYMGAIGVWNNSNNNTTYNLSYGDWNEVAFEVGFGKVMAAWKETLAKLKEDKSSVHYALAQVLKIAAMHRVTDNYGPLPYLKFGSGSFTTPYDSQEVIYKSFFTDLNEAIAIMTDFVEKNPAARPLKQFDMVYGGDFSKWLKFANSLKLRLAIRIVYVEPGLAQQYAEEAVASGVMLDNIDNAQLKTANGIAVYHPLKKCWDDYSDIRMGANMESFLTGYSDDRISRYFTESTLEGGGYHGIRNGINVGNKSKYMPLSAPNIMANDPVQWMCAAEVYFLRAEGALRGWSMGKTAKELYEQGITTSFGQWKANIGSYLSNNTLKPAAFIDKIVSGNSIQASDPRLSTITIAWNDADDFERKLERVITQKWIAMFPDGQEAWTEYRRTGYPKVFPVAVNNSGNTINTELQIRRITFPRNEYSKNGEEVRKAITLLGGPDTGGTKLWWDKRSR